MPEAWGDAAARLSPDGDEDVVSSSGNVFDDLDTHACGNCDLFLYESATGYGWCAFHDYERRCDQSCRHWSARSAAEEPCSEGVNSNPENTNV